MSVRIRRWLAFSGEHIEGATDTLGHFLGIVSAASAADAHVAARLGWPRARPPVLVRNDSRAGRQLRADYPEVFDA